jgi:hypothetical protein
MSLLSPSCTVRPLPGLLLSLLLVPRGALAAPVDEEGGLTRSAPRLPAEADEPPLDPRLGFDPRVELDFRLDRDGEARPRRSPSSQRAPVWFSLGATFRQLPLGEPSYGAMFLLGLPLDRVAARSVRAEIAEAGGSDQASPRRKIDLTPPPPPPKLAAPASAAPDAPLRLPVVVITRVGS